MARVKIVGAGLAGCECAFALARQGHSVDLFEMRPAKTTAAHQTSNLAELVCSNSFRSSAQTNAVGLLKHEMKLMDSDAIAPIIAAESLDLSKLYWKSRYDKGDGRDYLNAAMTQEQYEGFIAALLDAELYPLHDFERAAHFEGCLPIEEIASRGIDTLRFGPMKPVGLDHPQTGERPHAVVQLRKEDLSDEYFNIVGFQTKMKVPEQKRVITMIPGLANAQFARFGSMHRNTFINGPRHLRNTFQTKRDERVFFAGQITGVEGYVESAAVGLLAARYIDEIARGGTATPLPYHTALGALGRHVAESSPDRYQPSNVTWALIEDVIGRAKKVEKRERQVRLAIDTDRKSTRLNSSHANISYAVFCLKKKKKK